MRNELKRRLAAGDRLYGAWLSLASPALAELLGCAGYDFLVVDNEHGAASLTQTADLLRAAAAAACPVVVRVPWNDQVYLKRVLDLGAQSIMVPLVETAEEAAAAVTACRYPPDGRRGYAAPAMRCSRYGFETDYFARANAELLLIAQIESAAAAARAEAIAAVDGVDMVLIGVNDLAGSIGLLERLDRPEVAALVAQVEAGVRRAGKPLGSVPSAAAATVELFARGYQLVAGAGDVPLLRDAARTDLAIVRAALAGGPPSAG